MEVLVWIVVAFFKATLWLTRLVLRGLARLVRWLRRPYEGKIARTEIASTKIARTVAQPVAKAKAKVVDLSPRVRQHLAAVQAMRTICEQQRNTLRFVLTLDALVQRGEHLASQLRIDVGAGVTGRARHVADEQLLEIVGELVNERRGALSGLLDDTDALANASYAPIVEYCRQRDLALSSDRAATAVDGDKLFFMSIDDPAGLTTIVLPSSFGTEISTWPAIAHEIAHDFFRSLEGLPTELRSHLQLGTEIRLVRPVDGPAGLQRIPERAVAAWMEELFADAFGTMMLGPAYVLTMMHSFGSPADPDQALAMSYKGDKTQPVYEEHPPGHVRVVAGCRLLGRMGYGKEADDLEARWRRMHGNPTVVYSPLSDGRWLRMNEGAVLDRAAQVGTSLYMNGLDCLRGQPLRSIAGLDFGPREHEHARRISERLSGNRPVAIADPRLLVAGAVLATFANPTLASSIYARARDAIAGVDTPAEERGLRTDSAGFEVGADAAREAFIAGVLFGPPRCRS